MLAHNEHHVYEIAWRSIYVSGVATVIGLMIGVSFGAVLAFKQFRGKVIVVE